ncbi:MAG: OsmC family protein [SAR202 cluster bacterium]|nr:OsmC family protein [SAR202 cluster bacterium]
MPQTVTVRSRANYQTQVISGKHQLLADEPQGVGDDLGMSPTQLLLGAIGACASITLRMYAARKGWPLERVEVTVELERERGHGEDRPRILSRIKLFGDLSEEQRQRFEYVAARCPVRKLVSDETEISDEVELAKT